MNKQHCMILGAALAGLAIPGSAAALDFAAGAHAGTMGPGVEITLGLNPHLNLRAGINSGKYEIMEIEDEDGLEYDDPEVDFDNQYVMLDFYPFSGGKLHLTAGYFMNSNTIATSARVDDTNTQIGNQTADIDTQVNALLSFDDGGYAGIGFGNSTKGGWLHFGVDIGVVLQGSPKVDIEVIEPPAGITISEESIAAEEREFEEENKDFDMWPMINVGLSIQFF